VFLVTDPDIRSADQLETVASHRVMQVILPATFAQHVSITLENLAAIDHVVPRETGHGPFGKRRQEVTVFTQERRAIHQPVGRSVLHRTSDRTGSAALGGNHHLSPPGRDEDMVLYHCYRIRRCLCERDGTEIGNSSPFGSLEDAHPGKVLPDRSPKIFSHPVHHQHLEVDRGSFDRESFQTPGKIAPPIDRGDHHGE
jgi:hypothetical protein